MAEQQPTLSVRTFAGLIGKIQEESECDRTGYSCKIEAEKCACWLEAWGEIEDPRNHQTVRKSANG